MFSPFTSLYLEANSMNSIFLYFSSRIYFIHQTTIHKEQGCQIICCAILCLQNATQIDINELA